MQTLSGTRRSNAHRLLALAAATGFWAILAAAQTPAPPAAQRLSPKQPAAGQLRGGETRAFSLNIGAGQFVRAEVTHSPGFDVLVSLFAPDGKLLVEMDGQNGHLWRESVSCVSEGGGLYTLQVKAYGTADSVGSYRVGVSEPRAAQASDRKRVEAERAFAEGRRLYDQGGGVAPEAAKPFAAALGLWRELGDRDWEAVTLIHLGWTHTNTQRYDEAIDSLGRALNIFRELKDLTGEGKAANGLGIAFNDTKRYEKAREFYERSLAIRRELKDRRGEGATLANLGEVYENLNQPDTAEEHFKQGLLIAREVKNYNGENFALSRLGLMSFEQRKFGQGVEYFEQVVKVRRLLGDLTGVRHALYVLGTQHVLQAGGTEKARAYFEEALEISRRLQDRQGESKALFYLGFSYRAAHHYEKARQFLEQSLALKRALADKSGEADVLQYLGSLYSAGFQDCQKAREILEQALAIKSASPDRAGESSVLDSLSTAHLCLGNNEKVIEYSERALAIQKGLNNKAGQITFLIGIAAAYANTGLFEKAMGYYEQALAIARESKLKDQEAYTLGMLANNYSSLDQHEKARELYEQTVALAREIKNVPLLNTTLPGAADTYASLRQNDKALEFYKEALALCRETKDTIGVTRLLQKQGYFHANLRQFEQARALYEEALALSRANGLTSTEIHILAGLGNLYIVQGQYEKSLGAHEEALALARRTNNTYLINSGLAYVGNSYLKLNQYEKAQDYLEQSLAKSRESKNLLSEALASLGLGMVYLNLNEYGKARDSYERALVLARETKQRGLVGITAGGVGDFYADINQSRRAQGSYEQSLALMKELLNRRGEGRVRNALGNTYLNLKQFEKARAFYEEALAIAREVKEKRDEAHALVNLGTAYKDAGQPEKARPFYEQGLALSREARESDSEAAALHGLGEVHLKTKRFEQAHDYYRQSLAAARRVQSRKREAAALWGLMALWNERKNSRLAVLYGKQAVNAFQTMRGALRGFDRETQQTFMENKQDAYRALADTLITLGRIHEAEQVLAMLKEEELFNFVRRDDAVAKELLGRIPLNDPEREAVKRYEALADSVTAIGRQVAELEEESFKYAPGKFPRQAQLDELEARLADASKVFNRFIDELSRQFRNRETQGKDTRVAQLSGTRGMLARLNQPQTVVVSTIAGRDRLNIIVTTTRVSRAHVVDIKADELNRLVAEFRAAITDTSLDPRPAGKRLYDKLFPAGLKKDLAGVGADTIVWSLDGALRYVPMAALWDGEKYLAERYANAVITLASLDKLGHRPAARQGMTILGAGVSKEAKVAGTDGEVRTFSALGAVPEELCDIVNDAQKKEFCARLAGRGGLLDGVSLLDEEFTLAAFKLNLIRHPFVHVASHFTLNAGSEANSYLLLGSGADEGRKLTLKGVRNELGTKFSGVELLTLSACNTAMGAGERSGGEEIEGFGALAQEQGAKSVLATLWAVADKSTQLLMSEFYRLLKENPQMGKAEALRRAQLTIAAGGPAAAPSGGGRRDTGEVATPSPEAAKYSHPYYWSPFVLMGNWH